MQDTMRKSSASEEEGSHQNPHLDLGLPVSRTVKNMCFCFLSLQYMTFCYWHPGLIN
jgi:hypothetical protein